jgi:hypothetical protein
MKLSIATLCIVCCYAECCNVEHRILFIVRVKVIMLSVVVVNANMLSVIMVNTNMLSEWHYAECHYAD